MIKYVEKLAKSLLGIDYKELSEEEKRVIDSIASEEIVVENINDVFAEEITLPQKVADYVSRGVGSWSFIIGFTLLMAGWVAYNSWLAISPDRAFDPYPYILLNLGLSTVAALQAPIIMMSQNRQAAKDKLKAEATYEVGLKSELEIMLLHQKVDELNHMLRDLGARESGEEV